AGAPVKLLAEGVTAADNLALIPVTNKSAIEFYPTAEIPANTYGWQTKALPTVAVQPVLESFDFLRLDLHNGGRSAQSLASNIGWLRDNGHAKRKTIQLDYPVKGWEQYDCVRKYVGRIGPAPATAKSSENPVLDAIKGMLRD